MLRRDVIRAVETQLREVGVVSIAGTSLGFTCWMELTEAVGVSKSELGVKVVI